MSVTDRMAKILETQGQNIDEWKQARDAMPYNQIDREVQTSTDREEFLKAIIDDLTEQRERGRAGLTKLLKAVDAGEDSYKDLFLMATEVLSDTLANRGIKDQVRWAVIDREKREKRSE